MIELVDAVTGYGRARILDRVSLSVRGGEVLAVVGPNGAGKTTLMGAIAGLLPLWEGKLLVDGQDCTALPAEARTRIGVVLCPEGRRILSTMTVEENLRLGATSVERGAGADGRRMTAAAIEEAYERFPILGERRRHRGGALSGGQQQMLAIARALMARPKVLLLDEPSLGLAPRVISEVYELLAALRADGLAIVLVEEGARRALAFADRGVVLRGGAAVLAGTVAELRAHPDLGSAYLGSAAELDEDPTVGRTA